VSILWSEDQIQKRAKKFDVFLSDLREGKQSTAGKVARAVIVLTLGLLSGIAVYMEKQVLGYALLGAALLVAFGAFTLKNGNHNGAPANGHAGSGHR